jgi:DNA (cytosine-5)-methyltransferase 1
VRPLTTRERAMIQTFPESFQLSGTKSDLEQLIGNAVPVKLAEFVAQALLDYVTGQHRYVVPNRPIQLKLFEASSQYASHAH